MMTKRALLPGIVVKEINRYTDKKNSRLASILGKKKELLIELAVFSH